MNNEILSFDFKSFFETTSWKNKYILTYKTPMKDKIKKKLLFLYESINQFIQIVQSVIGWAKRLAMRLVPKFLEI